MQGIRVHLTQSVSWDSHLALSTYLRELSLALSERAELEVHVYPVGVPEASTQEGNVVFHPIKGDLYTLLGQFAYYLHLREVLAKELIGDGLDVIHSIYPNSSLAAAASSRSRFETHIPIVYDVRSPWIEMAQTRSSLLRVATAVLTPLMYRLERRLARHVDRWVFITDGLATFYQDRIGCDDRRSVVVPSAVNVSRFRDADPVDVRGAYGLPESGILVGYVGAISLNRELEILIDALSILADSHGEFGMLFIGAGNAMPSLLRKAWRSGLGDRVKFTGQVHPQDVPALIASLDVGVSHLPDTTAFQWSFPLKILEYSAAAKRVVASNVECHRRLADELDIVLYDVDDAEGLANAVIKASGQQAENDRPMDISNYSWSEIAARFASQYGELLA